MLQAVLQAGYFSITHFHKAVFPQSSLVAPEY